MAQQTKPRITRLIEAVRAKDWTRANSLISGILETKVMTRLGEERKSVIQECPMDMGMKKEGAQKNVVWGDEVEEPGEDKEGVDKDIAQRLHHKGLAKEEVPPAFLKNKFKSKK